MRSKRNVAVAIAALAVLATSASASAATHSAGTFVFPSEMCGFQGTSTLTVVDNFGTSTNASYDAGRLVETFMATNGRGITIAWDAGRGENLPPTVNPDGSETQVSIFSGLNAKVRAVGGPVLEQGSGRVEVTVMLDANGNVVGVTAVSLAGQNPNLSGAPDCSVIAPYLAGG